MAAGSELSMYVILGIGGRERTEDHAVETAKVLNISASRGSAQPLPGYNLPKQEEKKGILNFKI